MIADLHCLRPWWFLMFIPLLACIVFLWRKNPSLGAWTEICDRHLLEHLIQNKGQNKRSFSFLCLYISMFFMIISLAGPSWHQLPVPIYKPIQPRVLLLDMSDEMMKTDLSPNRLSRAKFKLHDLFAKKDVGQFGLIAYTGEPFVVSPLTDDGQTIASLLEVLIPDVMPVGGQKLESALNEAKLLLHQAGYSEGQILVLTANTPSIEAINEAKTLAQAGIFSSIMPVLADNNLNPLFQRFATSGSGQLVRYSSDASDLEQWLNASNKEHFVQSKEDDIPLWRDEGRWFLIPALLFFLPVFQRGWLQRMAI